MFNRKRALWRKIICVLPFAVTLALVGCGGSSSSGAPAAPNATPNTNNDGETLSTRTLGYSIPTKISAVPENKRSMVTNALRMSRYATALAASDLPANSDYARAVPQRYIEERSLEQFDILEQVLGAFDQTHFADEENINAGPYKAMVAWEDEQDGRAIKQLEPWVVDSRMIVDDQERDVNRVLVWIEEPDESGGTQLVKAEARVYASAEIDADGTITDYGLWNMNVSFGDSADDFFTASSSTEDGVNVLKMQDHFVEGPPDNQMVMATKGVLYRTGTLGYGQVQYPDWESCWKSNDGGGDQCVPELLTVQYSYNDDYLALQQGSDVVYRDRDATTEMVHRYGLFYKEADPANGIAEGDSLEKHLSFGFPVTYTDDNGFMQHAYYGAWQGRHELWGGGPDGGQIPPGITVTEEAFGDGDTPASYTVSQPFNGTFTRRTLAEADLNDIKGIPVETWVNDNYELTYEVDTWKYCDGNKDWDVYPPNCLDRSNNAVIPLTPFTDFVSLVTSDGGRKNVNINRWDDFSQQNYDYVYLDANPNITGFTFAGAGFYVATRDNNGMMRPNVPAAKYAPQDGDNMWVNIGGSIYIQYTGDFTSGKTGWVEKQLTDFIEQTWTPVFGGTDVDFSPEQGNEYYINNQGANYIVRRVDSADALTSYEVKSELQTSANPVNYASLLPAGTSYLRTPWRPEVRYSLVTDSADPDFFLKLVYLTDDPNTPDVDESKTTTVYTSGEWGLQAFNSSDEPLMADGTPVDVDEWGFPMPGEPRPTEYNWEYSDGGWGTQQFLLDDTGAYVVLHDPIQLQPVTVTYGVGEPKKQKTLSLSFDGWMHGMPDMYQELSKSNWVMTPEIADKIINLPAATVVTDTNGVSYFVKPLDISLFLENLTENEIIAAGGSVPDISNASQADLSTVPELVPHGMGDLPTETVVKYSEGNPVN